MAEWWKLRRFGIASACVLALATPAAAEKNATILSIDREEMQCTFDVVFQVEDAGQYAVNLWDDGSYVTGVQGDFAAGAVVTVTVTIGAPALPGATGIGVYVQDAAGEDGGTTYGSDGSYQYPDDVGNGCQLLGFTFGAKIASVVEPTTTTTTTTSTTSTSTTSTTLPSEMLSGQKLMLLPTRLALLSNDRSVTAGRGLGTADDPTLVGGALRLRGTGFDRTFTLPAGAWGPLSRKKPEKGYRLRGAAPVTAVVLKPGKQIKIAARGDLGVALDADVQPVQAELRIGGRRYCFAFGGRVRWKAGKKWTATKAPPAVSCPP
ncbi:MAG: hypothetical protein KIT14_05230 [bacterium]|nr:hypothetical protein [bacterium]